MSHPQRTETLRKTVALSDVFEAFVEADRPQHRSIGFGLFDPSGTMVDRLLAVLPEAAVQSASKMPDGSEVPAPQPAEPSRPHRPSP